MRGGRRVAAAGEEAAVLLRWHGRGLVVFFFLACLLFVNTAVSNVQNCEGRGVPKRVMVARFTNVRGFLCK